MPVSIRVNGTSLSLVHKFSTGVSIATIPDVCKTPSPGGPVPVPYPNIANSITLSQESLPEMGKPGASSGAVIARGRLKLPSLAGIHSVC